VVADQIECVLSDAKEGEG